MNSCQKTSLSTICLHLSRSSYICPFYTCSISKSLFSNQSLTPSIHLFLCLSTGLLPCGYHSRYFLGFQSSSILLTCPYHLSYNLSTSLSRSVTPNSSHILSILILSFLVTLPVCLSIRISAVWTLDILLLVSDQHSYAYIRIGLKMVL